MVKKYIILKADTSAGLSKQVNEKISEGYKCQGGLQISCSGIVNMIYAQSMILKKDKE